MVVCYAVLVVQCVYFMWLSDEMGMRLWPREEVAGACWCVLVHVTSTVPGVSLGVWTTTMPNHPLRQGARQPSPSCIPQPACEMPLHILHTRPGTARYSPSPPNLGRAKRSSRERSEVLYSSYLLSYLTAHTVVPRLPLADTQLHASCCHSLSAYPGSPVGHFCVVEDTSAHALDRAYTSNSRRYVGIGMGMGR